MPLQLLEVQLEDFETMINHANIYLPGDDLVGPPTPLCWPITSQSSQEESIARLTFHVSKLRSRFLGDPTGKYLKIVDEETKEIISIARWHYYPSGYSYTQGIGWELHTPISGQEFPEGMNIELHNYILDSRDKERENWMEKGKPCYVLMHLVTRPSQRKRGAAGMLINWGIEKGKEEGVLVYLEAGAMAKHVYEKLGFRQNGEHLVVDLRGHGMDMDFVMAKMQIKPEEIV